MNVVGHVGVSDGQLLLNHGVPPFGNLNALLLAHPRPGVPQVGRRFRVAGQHVEQPHRPGVRHQGRHLRHTSRHECGKGGVFEGFGLFFGIEDLGFQFLQLFGDVALCLGQGLLADPAFGNFVLVGIADFEVVAKHVVEGDFQSGDACDFCLSIANGVQRFLAVKGQTPHLVQFVADALGDDFTFANGGGGFVHQFLVQPREQGGARRKLLEVGQEGIFARGGVGDALHGVKSPSHMPHLSGIDAA